MTTEEEAAIAAEAEAKAKAEAEAKANAEAEEAAAKETEEESEEESSEGLKIDYEAELAKEREAREKAEKALAEKAFKEREVKRKSEEGSEDKPLTARELEEILAKERQETQKVLYQERIKEIAKSLAGSDAESNLIVEIHKNRTFPSHLSLEQQIEESYAIANRERILAQNSELKRALRSKETASGYSGESYKDSGGAGEPKLSPQDAEALHASGMVWDPQKRVYKSPIGKNKHFYYDPKSKKRWTA